MIKTAKQLKDLIRNRTGGDSNQSQIFLRIYMMERILERLSLLRMALWHRLQKYQFL